jgi:pilus assembly protein Flp/PilA
VVAHRDPNDPAGVFFNRILHSEDGATAIEYGLIAALIAVAAITAMGALGNSLSNTFETVSTQMNNSSDGKL